MIHLNNLADLLTQSGLCVRVDHDRLLIKGGMLPPAFRAALVLAGQRLRIAAYRPLARPIEPWQADFLPELNKRLPIGCWSLSPDRCSIEFRAEQPLPSDLGVTSDVNKIAQFVCGHSALIRDAYRVVERWLSDGPVTAMQAAADELAAHQPTKESLDSDERVSDEEWATILQSFGLIS
ncbi:UNVERIFIED_CONTAM: hypothetical protein BEN50_26000 [Euhalothece sp. KZN 001]